MQVESSGYQDNVDDEEKDVQEEEGHANCVQAWEAKGNCARYVQWTIRPADVTLPAYRTFAIPPVAMVIVKNVHVK